MFTVTEAMVFLILSQPVFMNTSTRTQFLMIKTLAQNINRNNTSRAYLKGVCKEIMVEHWPVLATNVYNDFTEFVTDEIGHRFVLSK